MINQYVIEKELGRGSYAKVHLAHDKNTGYKYAIKELNKAVLKKKRGESAYKLGLEELKVLERLEHPNTIWLHEVINDPKKEKIFLIT